MSCSIGDCHSHGTKDCSECFKTFCYTHYSEHLKKHTDGTFRICSMPGCYNKGAKHRCNMCYKYFCSGCSGHKHGIDVSNSKWCIARGCNKRASKHGMCWSHYYAWRQRN